MNLGNPFLKMFLYLRGHLKHKQFKDCSFQTNLYSTFNSHKTRSQNGSSDYAPELVQSNDCDIPQNCDSDPESVMSAEEELSQDLLCDPEELAGQLEYNLATFFLKMQSILHVTDRATQEFTEHFDRLFSLSEPILKKAVIEVLHQHSCNASDLIVSEIIQAVTKSNIFLQSVTSKGPLPTAKRRKSYFQQRLPHAKPVEYLIDSTHRTFIRSSLQELLKKPEILEKVQGGTETKPGEFSSYADGSFYLGNPLFAERGVKL